MGLFEVRPGLTGIHWSSCSFTGLFGVYEVNLTTAIFPLRADWSLITVSRRAF